MTETRIEELAEGVAECANLIQSTSTHPPYPMFRAEQFVLTISEHLKAVPATKDVVAPLPADELTEIANRLHYSAEYLENRTFTTARSVDDIREMRDALNGIAARPSAPIPMVLHCPECRTRHIDVGEFATKPHHTHACQDCGMVWRPAIGPTVGVQYLPGFKNGDTAGPCIQTVNIHGYRLREKCSDITFSGKHDREGCTGAGASCLHHRPLYAPAAQERTAG